MVRLLLHGDSHQLSRLGLDPAEEHRQRTSYEPLLQGFASQHANVEYISIFKSLCDEVTCPLFADDTPLYRDGDHLSHEGALRLTHAVYDHLFAPSTN